MRKKGEEAVRNNRDAYTNIKADSFDTCKRQRCNQEDRIVGEGGLSGNSVHRREL